MTRYVIRTVDNRYETSDGYTSLQAPESIAEEMRTCLTAPR